MDVVWSAVQKASSAGLCSTAILESYYSKTNAEPAHVFLSKSEMVIYTTVELFSSETRNLLGNTLMFVVQENFHLWFKTIDLRIICVICPPPEPLETHLLSAKKCSHVYGWTSCDPHSKEGSLCTLMFLYGSCISVSKRATKPQHVLFTKAFSNWFDAPPGRTSLYTANYFLNLLRTKTQYQPWQWFQTQPVHFDGSASRRP